MRFSIAVGVPRRGAGLQLKMLTRVGQGWRITVEHPLVSR